VSAVAPHPRASRTRRVHAKTRAAGQRRLAGGVAWIVGVAALLAGVVAVNVAVLQLNLRLDGANRQRAQLKADIAADQAKLASAKRTAGIIQGAQGLVPADPPTTSSINLAR
jgi:ABC-type cobalamin transport system permease subunit